MKNAEIVIACYKPMSGKEKETLQLVADHFSVLSNLGFVTDRKPIVFQSKNATVVEVFEWASKVAAEAAHDHPEVANYWEKMAQVCSFVAPGELPEVKKAFSHFKPVN